MITGFLSRIRKKVVAPFAYKVINKELKGATIKVLDIGCGEYIPRVVGETHPHFDYWGIDIQDHCVNGFSDKHKFKCVNIINDPLPFEDGSFDVVILSHVLEHLSEYQHTIRECHRVLKANGLIYIETPSPLMLILPSMEGTLNFFDDMSHIRPFTTNNLRTILKQNNYTIIACRKRRDMVWLALGLPLVLIKKLIQNYPLYGGYFWDLFGCVIYAVGKK